MAKKARKKRKTEAERLDEAYEKCEEHIGRAQLAWDAERKDFDKKLGEWAEVLKEDWDSEPDDILIVLKYKLSRTRKQLVKNDLTATTKRMEREILAVERLLDRVIKDDYLSECLKPVKAKYGDMKMEFGKKDTGVPNTVSCDFVWPKAKSQKRARLAFRRAGEKADRMKETDLKRAFELLAKNMWGWWD